MAHIVNKTSIKCSEQKIHQKKIDSSVTAAATPGHLNGAYQQHIAVVASLLGKGKSVARMMMAQPNHCAGLGYTSPPCALGSASLNT